MKHASKNLSGIVSLIVRSISVSGAVLIFGSTLCEVTAQERGSANIDVWIGTGRHPLSQGIYHCTLDQANGKVSPATLVAEADGPGFLALHPRLPMLYAVCTLKSQPVVAAYAIRRTNGAVALELVNSAEIGDGGATHLSVDPTGRTILTAQYSGGSVAVFSVNDDGSVKERTQLIDHEGASKVTAGRQDASHAHWAGMSPDNRFAFVPDLGLDQVVIYKLDAAGSKIHPHGAGITPPGSGPRHMKFHPNGKWIYVLNEINLTITLFNYDVSAGTMTPVETVATVPEDLKAKEKTVSSSEIRVHPGGKFVYSANRGHDTISAFAVNPENGRLKLLERENVRGATPRNFNIDPTGRWLLAAGQDSHTVAVFAVDTASGELMYNGSTTFAPAPICVLFGPEH